MNGLTKRQVDYARSLGSKYGFSVSKATKYFDALIAFDKGNMSAFEFFAETDEIIGDMPSRLELYANFEARTGRKPSLAPTSAIIAEWEAAQAERDAAAAEVEAAVEAAEEAATEEVIEEATAGNARVITRIRHLDLTLEGHAVVASVDWADRPDHEAAQELLAGNEVGAFFADVARGDYIETLEVVFPKDVIDELSDITPFDQPLPPTGRGGKAIVSTDDLFVDADDEPLPLPPYRFVNLTPHVITIVRADGSELVLQPEATPARCIAHSEVIDTIGGIDVYRAAFGAVTGLPEPQARTIFVVSRIVAEAIARTTYRTDVFIPGEGIRDADGRIVGCKGLARI